MVSKARIKVRIFHAKKKREKRKRAALIRRARIPAVRPKARLIAFVDDLCRKENKYKGISHRSIGLEPDAGKLEEMREWMNGKIAEFMEGGEEPWYIIEGDLSKAEEFEMPDTGNNIYECEVWIGEEGNNIYYLRYIDGKLVTAMDERIVGAEEFEDKIKSVGVWE